MLGLIRRNRRPTFLRHLVSALSRDIPKRLPVSSVLPSHHILCAGTYSPVFARLAAESALAACPPELRNEFRLFIHVDGVASRVRADLMAWLGEVPGVELTYGLFGILPQDRIPGKWHQVMINDVVSCFRTEKHLAFIDADLFIVDTNWWHLCNSLLSNDVYALSAGMRENRQLLLDGVCYNPIKTNLFTLNVEAHLSLNQQRFNKDHRALDRLLREYPTAHLLAPNIDTLIATSLRAQAHGLRAIDVDDRVEYCHVGGFSHLRFNKFAGFESPENRPTIESWLTRLRLLIRVLDYFLLRGWSTFIESGYRNNVEQARDFVASIPLLHAWMKNLAPTRHELAFEHLLKKQRIA